MYRYLVWAFIASAPILAGSALQTEDVSNGDNWRCRDGFYIPMEARCDGVLDCKDHSDESHALCWKLSCPPSRFRCAYGACVDSTAPCNGKEECADGSDEVMPRCRNNEKPIRNATFTCYTGETIHAIGLCDGEKDCVDGSDESLAYCAGRRCAYNQFQCKYGACVDPGSNCDANQIQNCADASDESDELCNRNTTTPSIEPDVDEVIRPCDGFRCNDGKCLSNKQRCDLIIHCTLAEDEDGCEFCELPRHHSVTYFCGDRECNELEPSGTEARPVCRDMYIYNDKHDNMTCANNTWSYIATCQLQYYYVTEGNNLTLHIGENIAVHISGSQYTVSLEDANETISTKIMAITSDGPNEIVSDDTVVEITPEPALKRPSSHFYSKYFTPRPTSHTQD